MAAKTLGDFPTEKNQAKFYYTPPGMQAPCQRDVPHHKSKFNSEGLAHYTKQ